MCKSLGPVSFVIDDKVRFGCFTTEVVWMAGVEYSFSGIGFGWDSHAAWVGSAFGSPPFNFILHFNEDGAMLLMRRTGWARTNISHENGWNDIAWFV
jgi:hypothetical protein